jgi:uncharacterized membrane-anchored protein YitT (DUF2179 family)
LVHASSHIYIVTTSTLLLSRSGIFWSNGMINSELVPATTAKMEPFFPFAGLFVKTVDFTLNGIEEYIGVMIVSDLADKINKSITEDSGRGVTVFKA